MSKVETQIVQIRKKGGLGKIKTAGGSSINPKIFHQDVKDVNSDGVLVGDYKGKTLLNTKQGISPMWNDLKNQWSWGGTDQDLAELISKMKLRYPKNHELAGKYIEPGKNVAERLLYRADEVFNHEELYGTYAMEDGRVSLNLSVPREKFLYFCYKGDHLTKDSSSDEPVSKYIAAGTKFELVSPKKEIQKKKSDASKEIKAITLLSAMDGNEDRIRAICEIMDLSGYSNTTDVTGAWLLLKDTAAQNPNMSSKYNKSYQARFIELAEMTDEVLDINHKVIQAKLAGKLRRRSGYYISYDGSRLDGIDTDQQLVAYFTNDKNQDKYLELLEHLEDANK